MSGWPPSAGMAPPTAIISATAASIFCSGRCLAGLQVAAPVRPAGHVAHAPLQHRLAVVPEPAGARGGVELEDRRAEVLRGSPELVPPRLESDLLLTSVRPGCADTDGPLELGSLAAVGCHGGPPALDRRCSRRRRPLGVFQGEWQRRVEDALDAAPAIVRPQVVGATCPFRVRPELGNRGGLRGRCGRCGRRGGRWRRCLGNGGAVRGEPTQAGERRGGRSQRDRHPGAHLGRAGMRWRGHTPSTGIASSLASIHRMRSCDGRCGRFRNRCARTPPAVHPPPPAVS